MRALPIGLMVLGVMGIAVVGICGGNERVRKEIIAQESTTTKKIAPPTTSINKVVIGVLDFETSYTSGGARGNKKVLMRDLKRNTRVKLVDIRESCSLSDLKRRGYEAAERYRNSYQLDMILHSFREYIYTGGEPGYLFYFNLIDLSTKRAKEVSFETTPGISVELALRGISRKVLVSQDLNRVLRAKKEALAKEEVAVPPELKEIPKRETEEITPPGATKNKVVIGVLNVETGYTLTGDIRVKKNALMRELQRNTRVKLFDIDESCSLSDLKRHGYKKAEKYKMDYQLDMILHTYYTGMPSSPRKSINFNLIDLYTKRAKEVSIEADSTLVEFALRGISRELLVSQDLNRVLRAKKEALAKKEVAVSAEAKEIPKEEVKESPKEIEDPLIQNGPKLIAEGGYNRVLELIDDLPGTRRKNIQIQILECFANLKGWVWNRDEICKLNWSNLRQRLIISGDNEATPMLVIFLRDEDPWMRLYAAELLGHIGDERALKDLRDVGTNDENHKVRRYAKKAYKQISGGEF